MGAPKLTKTRSGIKMRQAKPDTPEPVKLALSQSATELVEPQKPVVEAAKLVRYKSCLVLKAPKRVAPETEKLALTESDIELKEPVKTVSEPANLVRSKSAIRIREPRKQVAKLLKGQNDITHKTTKAPLFNQVRSTSFVARKVIEEPIKLAKGSEDVTVTEKKQMLVAANKVVSYDQSKQVLSESADEQSVDEETVTCVLSNTTRDFSRDELVLSDNGLDIEEEYDWSYLKWYAGGMATQYLLSGKNTSVSHVHHHQKKSGRKQ